MTRVPVDKDESGHVAGSTADAGLAPNGGSMAELVARYQTPLLRYVGQLLGPGTPEVQDVVQDAFLRFHRHAGEADADGIRNERSWLFRVAHNLARDVGRRRQRQKRLREQVTVDPTISPGSTAAGDHPAAGWARREAQELAVREMNRLPDEQKHVLLLKIMQGMTLREISEVTGMKIGTVNYRLTQGLRELAKRLGEAGAV